MYRHPCAAGAKLWVNSGCRITPRPGPHGRPRHLSPLAFRPNTTRRVGSSRRLRPERTGTQAPERTTRPGDRRQEEHRQASVESSPWQHLCTGPSQPNSATGFVPGSSRSASHCRPSPSCARSSRHPEDRSARPSPPCATRGSSVAAREADGGAGHGPHPAVRVLPVLHPPCGTDRPHPRAETAGDRPAAPRTGDRRRPGDQRGRPRGPAHQAAPARRTPRDAGAHDVRRVGGPPVDLRRSGQQAPSTPCSPSRA